MKIITDMTKKRKPDPDDPNDRSDYLCYTKPGQLQLAPPGLPKRPLRQRPAKYRTNAGEVARAEQKKPRQ